MRITAFAVNRRSGQSGRSIAKLRGVAYTALIGIPTLIFAPGCGGEPAEPPPGAPKTDPSELEAPTIELGEEADPTGDSADATTDDSSASKDQ